jgi:hypothetical protein
MFGQRLLAVFILLISANLFSQAQDNRGATVVATSQKVALVIGNSAYDSSIGKLKNPANDAADMAAALKRLGFSLVGGKAQLDLNKRQMTEIIRDFGSQIKKGGVGVFYFAGHGVQIDKHNYLIPITDSLRYQEDAEFEAVDVDAVLREMEYAENSLNILILDACRNNNLPKKTRNTGNGLSEPQRKPSGIFIAYAARDGQTASENTNARNGLYTQELLKNMETPNLRLEDIFINTRREVKRLSGKTQEPVEYGSLDDVFYFKTDGQQTPIVINSDLQGEVSFKYGINREFVIGKGEYEFITDWMSCAPACIYSFSESGGGIANSKQTNFDIFTDVTAYDMSSTTRRVLINEVIILKNKNGYYALVQVNKISFTDSLVSIKYKIIPNKLQSTWKYNPEVYISKAKSGKVSFDFDKNDGNFVIGEGKVTFKTRWSGCSSDCIYLFDTYIEQIALVSDLVIIKDSNDASRYPKDDKIAIPMKRGQRAVLKNSKGKYAVVTLIDIKAEGFVSMDKNSKKPDEINEVVFEYEILPD